MPALSQTSRLAAADLASDVRHAARQLLRRPGFSTILVVTLGLGIGATVALYSVVNDLLVRPLPYAAENQIQVFWSDYNWRGEEYEFVRERTHTFESLAEFSTNGAPYHPSADAAGSASLLPFVISSPSLFDVLGVHPVIGRAFDDADNRPGAPPVTGRESATACGTMTSAAIATWWDIRFSSMARRLRSWASCRTVSIFQTRSSARGGRSSSVHGRFLSQRGAPRARGAHAARACPLQRCAATFYGIASGRSASASAIPPRGTRRRTPSSQPVHEVSPRRRARSAPQLLLGAVGLLLLIACANGAALVLARITDRSAELSAPARSARASGALAQAAGGGVAGRGGDLGGRWARGSRPADFARWWRACRLRDGVRRRRSDTGLGDLRYGPFGLALVIGCAVSIAPVRSLLRGRFEASSFGRGQRAARTRPRHQASAAPHDRREDRRRSRCCWWSARRC